MGDMSRLVPRLLDLVLPLECAACGRPGAAWCRRCSLALARARLQPDLSRVYPDPCPPGLPPSHAWGRYAGPLRAAIRAWKDGGRRDLDGGLARLLGAAMAAALRESPWPEADRGLLIPIPSSRAAERLRGDRPLARVAGRALTHLDRSGTHDPQGPAGQWLTGPVLALRHRRGVADQAGLDARERVANLHAAMVVTPRARQLVRSHPCLLVDDVMTTGSTLVEATRALRQAGARDVRAAVIAATPRLPTADVAKYCHQKSPGPGDGVIRTTVTSGACSREGVVPR